VREHLARRFPGFYSNIRDNQLDETSSDLETLLGRPPTTLGEGLREVSAL
jgi:NAD(P)H dehydrogenase (quinone)